MSSLEWQRVDTLARQTKRRVFAGTRRSAKIAVHRARNAAIQGVVLFRKAGRRLWNLRKPVVRWRYRTHRLQEQFATYRDEWRVEREIERVVSGTGPIVIGPWLSEVGYEVLYWRPFLAWMVDRYRISPDRLVAVSRGGVADWYRGIAGRYVELLDLFDPEEFAVRNAARRGSGDQKQLTAGEFDSEILQRVAARHLGGQAPRVCHPSLMFHLFRRFWFGDRSLDFFLNHMRFERMPPPAGDVAGLPLRYAAVKFYTGAAVPDAPEHRRALRGLVARASEQMPVVVLDTGLSLDEHRDFLFEDVPNVTLLGERLTPASNLAVQTRVIAGASLFLGTCGSLAWLAPMLGTPTIGVYADDRFLAPHLFVARHAYRLMGAGLFTTMDLGAVDALDLIPDLAATTAPRARTVQ